MHKLLRFWLVRLLLFAVVGTGLTLALHIPGGFYRGPKETFTLQGRTVTGYRQLWSWELYWREIKQFGEQIRAGHLPYYRENADPRTQRPTDFMPALRDSWHNSALLFGYAVGVGSLVGVLLGALYALRSKVPRVLGFMVSTLGLSLPDFLVVILGQALTIWTYRIYNVRLWQVLADPYTLKGMALPILALTLLPMGYLARLTGAALDEIMWEDYIRTARAKGLPEWRVVLGHALRNAYPRVLAGLPGLMAVTLSSLVLVERLTTWPGLAKLIFAYPIRYSFMDDVGTEVWVGTSPQIIATAGLLFLACFVLLEGLAQTVRILQARLNGGAAE